MMVGTRAGAQTGNLCQVAYCSSVTRSVITSLVLKQGCPSEHHTQGRHCHKTSPHCMLNRVTTTPATRNPDFATAAGLTG